jgi:hypothetical protein
VDGRTCRLIAGMMARDKLDLFTFLVIRLVDSLAEWFGKLDSVHTENHGDATLWEDDFYLRITRF